MTIWKVIAQKWRCTSHAVFQAVFNLFANGMVLPVKAATVKSIKIITHNNTETRKVGMIRKLS